MSFTSTNRGGDQRAVLLLSSLGGFLAGLCCLTPIVLVLLGLASVTVANNWGNLLYGDYRWHFRGVALAFLAGALVAYFRRRGICTLGAAARERNRILNVTLLVLLLGNGLYIFWNYVVLHRWGIAAGLPWAQWDESWAEPVSAVLLGGGVLWLWLMTRRRAPRGPDQTATAPASPSPHAQTSARRSP